ncbi:hypothetical protein Efla_007789 [Eimeria flavescens]
MVGIREKVTMGIKLKQELFAQEQGLYEDAFCWKWQMLTKDHRVSWVGSERLPAGSDCTKLPELCVYVLVVLPDPMAG